MRFSIWPPECAWWQFECSHTYSIESIPRAHRFMRFSIWPPECAWWQFECSYTYNIESIPSAHIHAFLYLAARVRVVAVWVRERGVHERHVLVWLRGQLRGRKWRGAVPQLPAQTRSRVATSVTMTTRSATAGRTVKVCVHLLSAKTAKLYITHRC